MTDNYIQSPVRLTAQELRSFVERYERLQAEKDNLTDDQRQLMLEARGRGYDTKIIKKIITLRKKDPSEISEEQAVLEMYLEALGMKHG